MKTFKTTNSLLHDVKFSIYQGEDEVAILGFRKSNIKYFCIFRRRQSRTNWKRSGD